MLTAARVLLPCKQPTSNINSARGDLGQKFTLQTRLLCTYNVAAHLRLTLYRGNFLLYNTGVIIIDGVFQTH